jgi:hypothetical protein
MRRIPLLVAAGSMLAGQIVLADADKPDIINDFAGLNLASTHESPARCDSCIPVMFAGAGIQTAGDKRPIAPYAIAPTLSVVLGVKPASGSIGQVLPRVMGEPRS